MEGQLTAESTPGEGSVFHFTANFGIASDEQGISSADPKLVGRRVLVVDDNATNRRVLKNLIQHWKMEAEEVDSGEDAIKLLSDETIKPFDYIILDTQMPDIDGFGVAQFVQSKPSLAAKTSIIMMLSSTAQRGIVEKHTDLSISVYLNKPIGQNELYDALSKGFIRESVHDTPQPPVPLLTPTPHKHIKILLAEDNAVNQRLAIRVLEKLGYTVTLAENGLQAVAACEKEFFDLILMDVQMPEMGGFEATAKIRELESKKGIRTPIIAMTAHAIQGYHEKCLEGGMDGYISKPIHVETLKRTLEEILGKAEASKPHAQLKREKENREKLKASHSSNSSSPSAYPSYSDTRTLR
eukprot:TRINITY_DN1282_c0_g3_i2.p1 TRINITY_DN1282_c0_g3~~TRINITY_DN1282_c0_g3_i2.p1  ORF type:complete len:354 (+),score=113.38 TRINITY_DN1282_c0_g3_i2:1026-2087(+)